MSSSGTNNNTTKTYGSKKPTSVFSGFSSFSSSFGFGRSAQSSFNDRLNTKPETSDEIDDWLSAFNDPSFGKENNATNQNNGRTESRVPKEIRGDNRKRDDDEGISSTNRDIRRPKDLKALLGAHTFEDLERILRILDNGTQQYNKFLVSPHSVKMSASARGQAAQLLEHELVGFKHVIYGENMMHETTIQNLDKFRKALNARLSEKPAVPIEVKGAPESKFAAVVLSSSTIPQMSKSLNDNSRALLPDISNRVVRSISVDEADLTGLDSGAASPESFEPDLILSGSLDPRRKKFSPRSRSNSGSGAIIMSSSYAGSGFSARLSGKRRNIDECSEGSVSPRALPSPYSVPDSLIEGSQPDSDHGIDPHRAYAPSPTTAKFFETFEDLNVQTAKKSNNTLDHAFSLPSSQNSLPVYSQPDTVEEKSDGIYIESDAVAEQRDIEKDGIFDADDFYNPNVGGGQNEHMLEQKLVDVSDVLDMSTESREMGALGGLVSHTDHSGTDLSFNMIMSARSDVEKAHSDSMSNSFLGGRSTSSRSPEHAFAHFEVGRQMLEGDHDERSSLPYPVQHLRMSSGNTNRRSEEDLEVAHINRGIDDGAEEEFGASFNGQSLSQKEYNPLDNRKIRRHKRSKSESFILPIGLATPCQFLSQPAPINSARATFATPQNFNRFSIPDKDWGVSEPCCDEEILAIVCIYRPVGDEESAWTVPDAVSLCGNTNGCSIMEQAILSSLPPPSLTRHSSMPTLAGYEGRSRLSHSQSSKELHRGSKFYATFASPLRANPKIDEEDIDADVVLAVSDDVDQAAMLEKTAKKLKKKDVKWRRKSVADNKNKMDTSVDSNDNNFSPAYKGAVEADAIPGHDKIDSPAPQSKAPQRRHPKLSLLESISLHSRFEVSAVKPTSRIIDETNFKGVIIGGTYQHCFDLLSPVVAPPLSHEKRVVNVTLLEDRSLSIQLFIPSDREPQTVTLIRGWSCLRASPVGYLVSKSAMSTTRSIWYFIMRHPFGSPSSVATSSSRSMHSTFDSDADFETTEKAIRMLKLPAVEIDTTDDMQVTPYGQYEGEMSPDEDAERVLKGQSTHWDNSHVIAIAMSYLSENDRQSAQCVSKAWALASFKVVAQRKSCKDLTILDYSAWTKFIMQNGWGKFLSRGACKEVYAVHNKSSGQVQAVSVIDIEDLTRRNMESAVQQELEISILCSSLITLNICPNVIQIYSLFRSQYPAPSKNSLQKNSLWDQKFPAPSVYKPPDSSAIPTSKQITRLLGSYSDFQFIRMEFCTGGDMEELVRNSTGHLVDISIVRVLLFQMFYSMYCVRDQLSLRHYDLKLLNFFCTSGASLLSQLKSDFNVNARRKENICRLRIGFLNNIYELPLRLDAPDVVKLADFGTGVISQRTLGDFVTGQQFTTLENAPPEFLILGSTARQAYSADTFCIGLSFLHLLTGHEPYEELLKDVKCPSHFLSSLARLWASPDGPEQYNIINETINCLDTSDDDPDTGESIQRVFYHTFYRYLVLFGIPDELGTEGDPLTSNHVWRAVADAFGVLVNDERVHTRRASKGAVNSLRQYEQDRAMWSVRSGSDPIMCSVRQRLYELGPEASELFFSMVDFDPSRRCTMFDALTSPIFASLCVGPDALGQNSDLAVSYLNYYTVAATSKGPSSVNRV